MATDEELAAAEARVLRWLLAESEWRELKALRTLEKTSIRLTAEHDRMRDRFLRIAEAHSKSVDSAGGTWGDCAECGWSWPCPTNVWATTSRDVLAPWNPTDDDEGIDDA